MEQSCGAAGQSIYFVSGFFTWTCPPTQPFGFLSWSAELLAIQYSQSPRQRFVQSLMILFQHRFLRNQLQKPIHALEIYSFPTQHTMKMSQGIRRNGCHVMTGLQYGIGVHRLLAALMQGIPQ